MDQRKNELKALDQRGVRELIQVLKTYLPESSVAYNWLLTQSKWAENTQQNLVVLCPNGDWSAGSVLSYCRGLALDDLVFGVLYCGSRETEFEDAVVNCEEIPWDKLEYLHAVVQRNESMLKNVFRARQMTNIFFAPAYMHYVTAEEARLYPMPEYGPFASIPAGVTVKQLQLHDVDVVCDNWPHYDPQLRPIVEQDIVQNLTAGVYVIEDGQETLAAMVLQSDYGGVGMLQTVPKYKRLGYASLALAYLARQMGEAGLAPHLHVVEGNDAAFEFFKKTPFKLVCKTYWVLKR